VLNKTNVYGSIANMKECPYLHSIYLPNEQKRLKYSIRVKLFPVKEKIKTLDNYFFGVEQTKKEHHIGVCDSSCYNICLKKPHLQEIKNNSPYKIKMLLLFRDPVKHLYSSYCHNFKHESKKNFLNTIKNQKYADYILVYNKFKTVFGKDMLHFISEELFNIKEKQNSLEKFLDLPENCLDFSVHANKSNNMKPLSPEEYEYVYKQLSSQYDQWESKFGSLPSCWGKL